MRLVNALTVTTALGLSLVTVATADDGHRIHFFVSFFNLSRCKRFSTNEVALEGTSEGTSFSCAPVRVDIIPRPFHAVLIGGRQA
jgi:hypothetical protein